MMRSAMERGKWVFFQNCHLAPSWMPSLERLIEQIDPDKVSFKCLILSILSFQCETLNVLLLSLDIYDAISTCMSPSFSSLLHIHVY